MQRAHEPPCTSLDCLLQAELVAGGFMKPQADAQAAAKGAAKGRKAAKRQGSGGSGQGFRSYTTPAGLQARCLLCITYGARAHCTGRPLHEVCMLDAVGRCGEPLSWAVSSAPTVKPVAGAAGAQQHPE